MREQEPQSVEQVLRHKIDAVQAILANIETPGWIDTWPSTRTHPATKLSLMVDQPTRFRTLIGTIAPMRRVLTTVVLPKYEAELSVLTQSDSDLTPTLSVLPTSSDITPVVETEVIFDSHPQLTEEPTPSAPQTNRIKPTTYSVALTEKPLSENPEKIQLGRFGGIERGRAYTFRFYCSDHQHYGNSEVTISSSIIDKQGLIGYLDRQIKDLHCSSDCHKRLLAVDPIYETESLNPGYEHSILR